MVVHTLPTQIPGRFSYRVPRPFPESFNVLGTTMNRAKTVVGMRLIGAAIVRIYGFVIHLISKVNLKRHRLSRKQFQKHNKAEQMTGLEVVPMHIDSKNMDINEVEFNSTGWQGKMEPKVFMPKSCAAARVSDASQEMIRREDSVMDNCSILSRGNSFYILAANNQDQQKLIIEALRDKWKRLGGWEGYAEHGDLCAVIDSTE